MRADAVPTGKETVAPPALRIAADDVVIDGLHLEHVVPYVTQINRFQCGIVEIGTEAPGRGDRVTLSNCTIVGPSSDERSGER